ncbi:MAG: cob(I)yrinic acid a,c-diamide adenosyltransferase [Blautia sp.]
MRCRRQTASSFHIKRNYYGKKQKFIGNGRGKTTLAIGQALRASSKGKSVIIIQFLKGNERRELDFLEELDQLDIKIFRFEKMECCYAQLNAEEQAEEKRNILNGLNFARKVVVTQECDFLVLDEILWTFG